MRLLQLAGLGLLGLALIGIAFLVPSQMRAVDGAVLVRAGARTPSIVDAGVNLLKLEKPGPARMLGRAAEQLHVHGHELLNEAVREFARQNPELIALGGPDPYLPRLISIPTDSVPVDGRPVIDLILPRKSRHSLLEFLQGSRRPGVLELLQNRQLETTTVFPPVKTASGQPLESAILLTAMLSQGDHLSPPLRDAIEAAALKANQGIDTGAIEMIYVDLLSLGRRLNWRQLIEFVQPIESTETLHQLAMLARISKERLPALFAAVHLAETSESVARYLKRFGKTGMGDLEFGVRAGRGAVRELLQRQDRVYHAGTRDTVGQWPGVNPMFASLVSVSHYAPGLAMLMKYGFVLIGALLLAQAARGYQLAHASRHSADARTPHLVRIHSITLSRQILFAVTLLVAAIVFFEPFLAQENQTREFPLRWTFPMAAEALRTTITNSLEPIMDQLTILALALFFSVQSILYILSLIKLAEIRRQPVSSDVKLQLLDNEENLFDAGLYVGLGGTVASLVFLALGVIKPSLMAAYASTLFGLLFVAILKICHVRPYRRDLILERETLRA